MSPSTGAAPKPIWAMVAMVTSVTVVLSDSFGTRIVPTLWRG